MYFLLFSGEYFNIMSLNKLFLFFSSFEHHLGIAFHATLVVWHSIEKKKLFSASLRHTLSHTASFTVIHTHTNTHTHTLSYYHIQKHSHTKTRTHTHASIQITTGTHTHTTTKSTTRTHTYSNAQKEREARREVEQMRNFWMEIVKISLRIRKMQPYDNAAPVVLKQSPKWRWSRPHDDVKQKVMHLFVTQSIKTQSIFPFPLLI